MHDFLVIGGGVIGLSLAWDLAKHGRAVHIIDQAAPGREASWAGAGILPAARRHAWQHPSEQLRGLASELHPQWANELKVTTGIETGYRCCGGLHLARTAGEAAALAAWAAMARQEGIPVERIESSKINEVEPGLQNGVSPSRVSFFIQDEAQLRNPWHLQALQVACTKAGVQITPN